MASSSSPLLRRVAPLLNRRIRTNHRLVASASSSSTDTGEAPPAVEPETIALTENCVRRLKELNTKETGKMLRLSVEAGGCSGFQYNFSLDDKKKEDDRVFEKDGVELVVDNVSYDFVKRATVDYVDEMIRSAFLVSANPSAVGGCSCRSSFMIK